MKYSGLAKIDISAIEKTIAEFYLHHKMNQVAELNSLQIFDEPLTGTALADDPLFARLKEETIVGNHHLTPQEWLPEGKTVISYFLPFTQAVRKANRKMGQPAQEWLYGRGEGEKFNNALRKYLVDWFQERGYKALAPTLDPRFKIINRKSNWSERHVAYIAAMGTFSLNCSLITKKGSAGRFGSIIVSADMEPTPRPYTAKDEYCSHCGACILRCPPLAITEEGKDHAVCGEYGNRIKARFHPRYGCGKCQTAVPCEDKIPAPH